MQRWSLAALVVAGCSGDELPAPEGLTDPPECPGFGERFEALKTQFQEALTSHHAQGGSLAVVCGGQVRAAGVGTIKAGGAAVTATTQFQMASVTKMFTAATALSLARDGIVDLAAPVSTIVPALGYGQVSLQQILAHSSGLPIRFPNDNASNLRGWVADPQNANATLWAPPGAVWYYNNAGYAVAGGLLETAASRPFPSLVQERVFDAFGMGHASMSVDDVVTAGDYAFGHSSNNGRGTDAYALAPTDSYYDDPIYAPMGGAWASADDMGVFVLALLGHGDDVALLAPAMVKQIRTGAAPGRHYGFGLEIDEGVTPVVVQHSGSVQGFLSDVELVPSAGVGVAVMVNSDWYFPADVATAALSDFVDIVETRPPPVDPSTRWSQLTGTYVSAELGRIEVSVQAGQLEARFVDKNVTQVLEPGDYDTYYFDWNDPIEGPIPAQLTFWVDGTSPATYFVSDVGVGARS